MKCQNSSNELERNYTPKMLASVIGVTTMTIYRWLEIGLPHHRNGVRGSIRISYGDYLEWSSRRNDCMER